MQLERRGAAGSDSGDQDRASVFLRGRRRRRPQRLCGRDWVPAGTLCLPDSAPVAGDTKAAAGGAGRPVIAHQAGGSSFLRRRRRRCPQRLCRRERVPAATRFFLIVLLSLVGAGARRVARRGPILRPRLRGPFLAPHRRRRGPLLLHRLSCVPATTIYAFNRLPFGADTGGAAGGAAGPVLRHRGGVSIFLRRRRRRCPERLCGKNWVTAATLFLADRAAVAGGGGGAAGGGGGPVFAPPAGVCIVLRRRRRPRQLPKLQ